MQDLTVEDIRENSQQSSEQPQQQQPAEAVAEMLAELVTEVTTEGRSGAAGREGGEAGASSGVRNKDPMTKEVAGEEPDIIQSVKSSSLGRDTVALPVAPPRKKRKNKVNGHLV